MILIHTNFLHICRNRPDINTQTLLEGRAAYLATYGFGFCVIFGFCSLNVLYSWPPSCPASPDQGTQFALRCHKSSCCFCVQIVWKNKKSILLTEFSIPLFCFAFSFSPVKKPSNLVFSIYSRFLFLPAILEFFFLCAKKNNSKNIQISQIQIYISEARKEKKTVRVSFRLFLVKCLFESFLFPSLFSIIFFSQPF